MVGVIFNGERSKGSFEISIIATMFFSDTLSMVSFCKASFKIFLPIIFLLIASDELLANESNVPVVEWKRTSENLLVSGSFRIHHDSSGKMDVNQFLEVVQSGNLNSLENGRYSKGIDSGAYWLLLSFEVIDQGWSPKHILSRTGSIKEADFYLFSGEKLLESGSSGYASFFTGRQLAHTTHYTFPQLDAGRYDLVIRLHTINDYDMHFNMVNENEFMRSVIFLYSFIMFYIGGLLILIVFHLLLYFRLNDVAYLFYSAFAGCMLLFAITYSGVVDYWLQNLGYYPVGDYSVYFRGLTHVFAVLFAMAFLKEGINEKKSHWSLKVILVYLVGYLGAVALFSHDLGVVGLIKVNEGIVSLVILWRAFTSWRCGFRPAGIYLLAWLVFLSSIIFWGAASGGLFHKNMLIHFFPLVGNLVEISIMAIALSMRMGAIRDAQVIANQNAIRSQHFETLVRVLCHDISNPLSVALESIKQIEYSDDQVSAKEKFIPYVKRSLEKINSLVSQMRILSAVKGGKYNSKLQAVDLGAIVQNVEENFADRLRRKNINLEIRCEKGVMIMADAVSLEQQILNNLMSNAIKFSFAGGRIEVSVGAQGKAAYLRVRDHGTGIAKDRLAHLFDGTVSTTSPGTENEQGTGFGLPIVKSFVEMYGGKISVTTQGSNEHDRGTEFTVTFPLLMKKQQ